MKWHRPLISPYESYSDYIIIQTVDCKTALVKWSSAYHNFYDANSKLTYSLNDIVKWAYVEEDDDIAEELDALIAIKSAVSHVGDLVSSQLTDGYCCGEDYRKLIGLDDLYAFRDKITKRILELDTVIGE